MCWRDSFTQREIFLHKHKAAKPWNRWRRGAASTTPRGLERGRNGRVQSTLRDCRPVDGLLTRMQPSERSPKRRPVLAKGVQRTTSISGSPSVDSFNDDNHILPHVCVPYAVRVGSTRLRRFSLPYFRIVPLAVQIFAFAVFIAISDVQF